MEKTHTRPTSVMDPTAWTIAEVYAQSVMQVCGTIEQCQQLQQELEQLQVALDDAPEFSNLLSAPLLPDRDKVAVVRKVFSGRVMPELEGLLVVLAKHDRLGLIGLVARRLGQLVHLKQGIVEVVVTTAVPLDDRQVQDLRTQLQEMLKTEVKLDARVDSEILGGMVARVGDRLIDASMRNRLEGLRKVMIQRKASAQVPSVD